MKRCGVRWASAADSGVKSTPAALGRIIKVIAGCYCESNGDLQPRVQQVERHTASSQSYKINYQFRITI